MKSLVYSLVIMFTLMMFASPTLAQSSFTKLGGCLVMDVYQRNTNNKDLDKYCLQRNNNLTEEQKEWVNRQNLSMLGLEVRAAYEIAERRISGTAYGVAGGRNVRLVIDLNEYVTAGISATKDTIYIMINTGLLSMIYDSVSAVGFEIAQLNGMPVTETGITFSEWMEIMRLAPNMESLSVPSPGPDKLNSSWFVQGLIPRSVLLQFVFSHELAHVHYGAYCGMSKPNNMVQRRQVEEACDAHAINTFNQNQESAFNLAQFLPAFQLAHASYLAIFSENYVSQAPIGFNEHAKTLIIEELKNAIPKRLDKNMRLMMSKLSIPNEAKPFLEEYFKRIRFNILPSLPSKARHESGKYLTSLPVHIDFGEPNCNKIDASFVFINAHDSRSVSALIEIQSRVIPRDGQNILSTKAPRDSRGNQYRLVDLIREEIVIKPKSEHIVRKILPCKVLQVAYPSVGARVVESSWTDM
ncbi:hypothetical protein [Rheinheimera faecalis]